MSLRFGLLAVGSAAALAALSLASNDARACGGCFHEAKPPNPSETTLVTGHRMVLSISTTQTVLWDQVQYSGSPHDFAWVLPVKKGARIEVSNDAWFEALDAATSTHVAAPRLNCVSNFGSNDNIGAGSPGCGCPFGSASGAAFSSSGAGGAGSAGATAGAGMAPPPPVTVVHQGSVGPYETVTLHANVKGALPGWLKTHGYAIDPTVQPIIDAYAKEGFDFIALRLQPTAGVQQMKPVRVVSPGAVPALPLRMVAAGTGANVDITLFVIGEGRWETQNFPNVEISPNDLSWDFAGTESNFTALRQVAFAKGNGRTWINAYSKAGALLSQVQNPLTGGSVQYAVGTAAPPSTIGGLYVAQGVVNGEAQDGSCASAITQYASSHEVVVDLCPDSGGTTSSVGAGGAGTSSSTGGTGTGSSTGGTGGAGTGGAGGAGTTGSTGGTGGATSSGSTGAGGACAMLAGGQIDANAFKCGKLDDLGVALVGMHPRDVWLTRLESNLPHAALDADLVLQAATAQAEVENWRTAKIPVNPPCTLATASIGPSAGAAVSFAGMRARSELSAIVTALAALGLAFARRAGRTPGLVPVRSR